MNSFDSILILQAVLAIILALTLCFAVWRACKAGGRVRVGFIVDVRWGNSNAPINRGGENE